MWTFFGLTIEHSEELYEEMFLLKHYGNWSFLEIYNLPNRLRRWFLERLIKEKEKKTED